MSKTQSLTKTDFESLTRNCKSSFTEYRKKLSDIYRVEFLDSYIKCAICATWDGVEIIYLDSHYSEPDHQKKLIGYITFVIAYKLNKNKPFERIEFNNNGSIYTIN